MVDHSKLKHASLKGLLAILMIASTIWLTDAVASAQASATSTARARTHIDDGKHHWLFPNHPRLRRITKAAGFGVATGGLAAPFLGMSVAGGAVAGAAEHSAVRGVKDEHDLKKKGKLDRHIW